jgi:hypothetical protein
MPLGSLVFTAAERDLWLCPTEERWMALRRTTLLLTTITVVLLLAFVYGCQAN